MNQFLGKKALCNFYGKEIEGIIIGYVQLGAGNFYRIVPIREEDLSCCGGCYTLFDLMRSHYTGETVDNLEDFKGKKFTIISSTDLLEVWGD